jgi:hypothetical protein
MNYIKHLTGFFEKVAKDDRLGPLHISMYAALFQFWNNYRFKNPLSIARSDLMKFSKISSKGAYHKCMKDLHNFGYIVYEPSHNPMKGSLVYLFNLQTTKREEAGTDRIKSRTSDRQLEEPYINTLNILNSKLAKGQAHENISSDFDGTNPEEKKKSSAKRKREDPVPLPVSIEEIKAFFAEQKSTPIEAEKFFNYFQSNGWKVGGRAPMKDWQAAARNWILNSGKFEANKKISSLHTSTNKNYGEPL